MWGPSDTEMKMEGEKSGTGLVWRGLCRAGMPTLNWCLPYALRWGSKVCLEVGRVAKCWANPQTQGNLVGTMEGQWTMILFPGPLLHSHSEHFLRLLLWGQDHSLVWAIEREHHLTRLSPLQTSQPYALPQWNPLIPSPRRCKSGSLVSGCIYPFIRDTPSPRKQGHKEPRGSSARTERAL